MNLESNIYGLVVPHAPTLLEDEMDHKNSTVINALQDVGKKMSEWGVEVVIAASTHWQTKDKFFIDDSDFHRTLTDYYGFRREVQYDVNGHPDLARLLLKVGEQKLIFPGSSKRGVDHAITIPLHFMFPEKNVPVIPISIAGTSLCAFRWGRTIGNVLKNWGGKALFMASGSLSHDLACFSCDYFKPEHELFDHQVMKLLSEGNGMGVLEIDTKLIKEAKPEGAFRDLFMLMGVMGSAARGQVLAYEKLPGVGHGVIEFTKAGYNDRDEELLASGLKQDVIH